MKSLQRLTAALLCLLGSPTLLLTQGPPDEAYRQGFWVGFGLGPGYAQIDCSMCGQRPANDPWDGGVGLTGYLAMGGTPRSNLLLGGEVSTWSQALAGTDRSADVFSLTMTTQYYPRTASRLFVKAGAGFGYYSLVSHYSPHSFFGRTSSGLESGGWAVHGGTGYDFLVGRRLALVPSATLVQTLTSGLRDMTTGAALSPSNPRYMQFSMGLHWY
jgi:hypothetical protein